MRAGRLNQSVSIYEYSSAQDAYGQESKTYTLRETVRAEVKVISENENENGGKYVGRTAYRVTMRYTTLSKQNRLVWGSENLEISEIVDPSHRRRELVVKAYGG